MKKPSLYGLLLMQFLFFSCVADPNYNLDKPVNTDINLFGGGVSLPVGSTSKIRIGDALDFSKTSVIKEGENGDYRIVCSMPSPFGEKFTIEKIKVPAMEFRPKTWLYYEFPPEVVGEKVPEDYSRTEPILDVTDTTIVIKLPDEIDEIRSVSLDTELDVHLQVSNFKIRLNKGLRLIFNKNIEIEPNADFLEPVGPGEARTNRDLVVDPSIDFSASIKKIYLNPEDIFIEDGQRKAKLNIVLTVIGDGYMDSSYFQIFPPSISLDTSSHTKESEISSAEVKLDYSIAAGDFGFKVETLPNVVKSAEMSLYDPCIHLEVENSSPIALLLEGNIVSSLDDKPVLSIPVSDLPVNAGGKTDIYICKESHEVPEGAVKAVSDKLSDIFREWPDRISISGLKVKAYTPDFINIELGREESLSYIADFFSPLSLSEGSVIEFEQKISGLGLNFDNQIELPVINIDFTAVSSLPFETTLTAYALDKEGEKIQDIVVQTEGVIPAASEGKESKAPIKIRLTPQKAVRTVDGIVFSVKTEAGKGSGSVTMNANQYFSLEKIVLSLPDGVTVRSGKKEEVNTK